MQQVTIKISDELYRNAVKTAQKTNRRIDDVLSESLEKGDAVIQEFNEPEFANWTDAEVLSLAKSLMPAAQSERMSELLDRQQKGRLTNVEKTELDIYLRSYQIGNLRKSQGIVEAVRRGLIKSPEDLV